MRDADISVTFIQSFGRVAKDDLAPEQSMRPKCSFGIILERVPWCGRTCRMVLARVACQGLRMRHRARHESMLDVRRKKDGSKCLHLSGISTILRNVEVARTTHAHGGGCK